MPISTEQLYLSIVTLMGILHLPTPAFGYTRITSPTTFGNIFSATASANHAILFNIFAAGLYALYKGKAATAFLHTHVVLFALTYVALLLLNFISWDKPKVEWYEMFGDDQAEKKAKDELVAMVVVPMVLFNFVILPFYVWRSSSSSSGCVQISASSA